MSEPRHLDDELLTALQDGDGSADDRAHLGSCTRCTERAQALAAVAALVAAPPPAPPDDAREAAVVAALAEARRPAVPRRRSPRRVPGWLLPAAAVVALLALVAAVVPRLGNGGGDDSAAGRTSAAESDDGGSGELRDGAAGGDAAARSAAPSAGDLGPVDDEAELARRVDEALAAEAAADEGVAPATGSCEAAFRASGQALGPLRLRADLVWRGQPAEVLADGDRAVVVATGGCATLAAVDLP